MDWYFGRDMDDLVVPQDEELLDRLPSPESWSKWGMIAQEGGLGSPKACFMVDGNVSPSLKFKGFLHEVKTGKSVHDRNQSSGSGATRGLSEKSLLSGSRGQSDCQLHDFTGIDQMDDIFLNSLLEDLPGKDAHQPNSSSNESQCDWEREVYDPQFNSYSEQDDVAPMELVRLLASSEETNQDIHVDEGQSMEEYILQDFGSVMAQLTDKTRLCFRDAFYRLAKSSEQQLSSESQTEDLTMEASPSWTDHDEQTGFGRKRAAESETNTIDRAVANLTFSKMDTNVQNFPIATPTKSNQRVVGAREPHNNYTSNQQNLHNSPHIPTITCDARVPIFVQKQ